MKDLNGNKAPAREVRACKLLPPHGGKRAHLEFENGIQGIREQELVFNERRRQEEMHTTKAWQTVGLKL